MLEVATATRYVTPLREGGSLPGIVEADDLGTYVVKFTGAGQGPKVLVAEVIVAGIAEAIGVRVPRLVAVDVPAAIARYEADEEVQDLLNASPGLNLGVDFLPGAFGYDGSFHPSPEEATAIVWLDALTANVDRTWSNPNLLVWHRNVWAIDHGAALWFHHGWPRRAPDPGRYAVQPFDASEHVLADVAGPLAAAHEGLARPLSESTLTEIVSRVPDVWLDVPPGVSGRDEVRSLYVEHLLRRLERADAWIGRADA